jgi:UDP-GlcNAc:undecaprenyl-phosphate GlcNAc-1-phosphate transferase
MENIIDINLGSIQLYDLLHGVTAFIFAVLMAFVTTPIARVIAHKIGAIDIPKDERRMHKVPMPRLGGLAIAFSFVMSVFLFYEISNATLGMIIGAFIIVLTGIIDDVHTLRPAIKFIPQFIAAGIVVSQGVVVQQINIFGEWIHFGHFAIPLTVLWIVGLTNAVNWIDGLDGLACGISTISALSLLAVTILIGEFRIALLVAILAGACIGFLPFNRNPAKIIMGDTGALFLGFVLAIVSIQGVFKVHAVVTFIIPFLILGVPIFDTVFAMLRRVLTGRSPVSADRGHLHHRLIDMGFTTKQSVRILYAVSALLGVSSIMLITHRIVYAIIIIALSLTISAAMWIIFRDEKMKYESGLMSKPEEADESVSVNEANEENNINIDLIEEKNEFKPAKAEKIKR